MSFRESYKLYNDVRKRIAAVNETTPSKPKSLKNVRKSPKKNNKESLMVSKLFSICVALIIVIGIFYAINNHLDTKISPTISVPKVDEKLTEKSDELTTVDQKEETVSEKIDDEETVSKKIDEEETTSEKTEEEYDAFYSFLGTTDQHFQEISLHEVECSKHGYKKEAALGVVPLRCGTMLTDSLMNKTEIYRLRQLASRLISSIGDTNFHNRESFNLRWINLHNVFRKGEQAKVFSERDFELVEKAAVTARAAVSTAFALPEDYLYYHGVCQFTRYKPVVPFSEFKHVDKVRSPNLVVTSILWLSTVDDDFGGGRLEFLTGPGPGKYNPILVEPKAGRFAAWTSSYENPHGVQEVYYGQRYALIFAFTVHEEFGHFNMASFREWSKTTDAF